MAEDKNGFRRHVRAAKEWLGETEESLDKEQEVKGDLSFMLARAELERAKDVQGRSKAEKLQQPLALLVAVLLATAAWWLWRGAEKEQAEPVPDVQPVQLAEPVGPKEEQPKETKTETDVKEFTTDSVAENENEKSMEQEEAATKEAPEPAEAVRLPDEDMQKLMSEAGRSLRAQ